MPINKKLLAYLFSVIVVIFLIHSTTTYLRQIDSIKQHITEVELPISMDEIYGDMRGALKKPIFISSLMAADTFVRDWVKEGEPHPEPMVRYLSDIQHRYKTLSAFFVSDVSRNYYHPTGVRQRVAEDRPEDEWYFRVKALDDPYEVNIDLDYQNSELLTIFINYRVLDFDGDFIGTAGVGVEIDAAKQFIEHSAMRYDHDIYFLDTKGDVKVTGKNTIRRYANLFQYEPLKDVAKYLIDGSMTSFSYYKDGESHYVLARYAPDFNWIILVEKTDGEMKSDAFTSYFIKLFFGIMLIITALFFCKSENPAK